VLTFAAVTLVLLGPPSSFVLQPPPTPAGARVTIDSSMERWGERSRAAARAAGWLVLLSVLALALTVRDHGSPWRAALAAALGTGRPAAARLSGLDYGTPATGTAGPRLAAVLAALDETERDRSPAAMADRAVGLLVDHRVDRTIVLLAAAARRAPRDPALQSDLAAAFLERGGAHDDALACGAAGKAVAAAPWSPEARYNLALALTRAELWKQAVPAWNAYLKLDARSGWAVTARRYLRQVSAPPRRGWEAERPALAAAVERGDRRLVHDLVSRFPLEIRSYVEEEVLTAWAAAESAGRGAAAARLLGGELARVERDSMVSDAVAAIDRAAARGAADLAPLVAGHLAYRRGLAVLQGDGDPLPEFTAAARRLAAGGCPFAAWAVLECAAARYGRREYGEMLAAAAAVPPTAARYPTVRARACWLAGLAHLKLADFGRALPLYREALGLYETLGEGGNAVAVHVLVAECLRLQGESAAAWQHRGEALAQGRRIGAWPRFHNALFDAAEALLEEGQPDAALYFQDEMTARGGDAVERVEALLRRARTRARLGDVDGGQADLAAAKRLLGGLSDRRRTQFEVDAAFLDGEILLRSDPARAARKLGEAIVQFTAVGEGFRLPPLYRKRAQALLKIGDSRDAEESLEKGIAECEAERGRIRDESLVVSFFEQVRGLYADMVRLQADGGRVEAAFAYAERARARSLLDAQERAADGGASAAARAGQVLGAPEIERLLPPGTALVEYAFLEDRTLAWVVSGRGLVQRWLPASRDEIRAELQRLPSNRGDWTAGAQQASERLYGDLIRPLRDAIGGATALAIVPDGELHQVPFAALRDTATGRYLVEDFLLSSAPSATLWARSLARRPGLPATAGGALVVGDPAFDVAAFAALAHLPGARREAARVAALYPGAELLTGASATPAAFLARAPRAPVIHLATHAQVDEDQPLLSAFVLAPAQGAAPAAGAGLLYARDIYRLRLDHTGLVVLAACDTAAGPLAGGEGVANLARPFLAAGVPMVVASLWQVDDAAANPLLYGFHRRVAAGEDPVAALRDEQIAALRGANRDLSSPGVWGTFEIFGAAAPAGH
jgi:CHAT domain-containing protein